MLSISLCQFSKPPTPLVTCTCLVLPSLLKQILFSTLCIFFLSAIFALATSYFPFCYRTLNFWLVFLVYFIDVFLMIRLVLWIFENSRNKAPFSLHCVKDVYINKICHRWPAHQVLVTFLITVLECPGTRSQVRKQLFWLWLGDTIHHCNRSQTWGVSIRAHFTLSPISLVQDPNPWNGAGHSWSDSSRFSRGRHRGLSPRSF